VAFPSLQGATGGTSGGASAARSAFNPASTPVFSGFATQATNTAAASAGKRSMSREWPSFLPPPLSLHTYADCRVMFQALSCKCLITIEPWI